VQLLQKHGHDRSREVRRDSSSQGTEDQRWERGRRASNATTTHSAISGGRDSSRESLRQLPPHLASNPKPLSPSHTHQLPHLLPPSGRHGSTREPWRPGRSPEQSPVIPSPLDTSSHVAPSPTSSVVASSPPTAIPADLEIARKAAMHSAAERARIRRQQDEEERERERERARKKAAELKENKAEISQTQELPAAQVGLCYSWRGGDN
jgi:serine/arginine repetitive matrix protein 2